MVVVRGRPHHERGPGPRHRIPETGPQGPVGGRQLGRLRGIDPAPTRLHEHVGRSGIAPVVVVPGRPDHDRGPRHRHLGPEGVPRGPIGRGQLGRLRGIGPAPTRQHEYVGRSGIAPVVVVPGCPDHNGGPGPRHRGPEGVPRGPVSRRQLGRLRGRDPALTRLHEDVGRPGIAPVVGVVVPVRPDHNGGPGPRHRVPEVVPRGPVGRRQLGRLRGIHPAPTRLHEHVGRPGGFPVVVVKGRPHHNGGPGPRHRVPEEIERGPDLRRQLGRLGRIHPPPTRLHEDVGRPGKAPIVVVPKRPDHDGVPGHRHRKPEVGPRGRVVRGQLGRLRGIHPAPTRLHKYVGRPGGGPVVVVIGRPHHERVPGHRHRVPEGVPRGPVGRGQRALLDERVNGDRVRRRLIRNHDRQPPPAGRKPDGQLLPRAIIRI